MYKVTYDLKDDDSTHLSNSQGGWDGILTKAVKTTVEEVDVIYLPSTLRSRKSFASISDLSEFGSNLKDCLTVEKYYNALKEDGSIKRTVIFADWLEGFKRDQVEKIERNSRLR